METSSTQFSHRSSDAMAADREQQTDGTAIAAVHRRVSSHARRQQLLTCAVSVFARDGFGEGRHAMIAREVGIAVPTVFIYFPTREALVSAVLEDVTRLLTEVAEHAHAQPKPAPEILRDHMLALVRLADTHPDHVRVWLDWSTAIRYRIWTRYLDFEEAIVRTVSQTLERGRREGSVPFDLDANDRAHMLVALARMLAQMRFAGRAPEKIEHIVQEQLEAVFDQADQREMHATRPVSSIQPEPVAAV